MCDPNHFRDDPESITDEFKWNITEDLNVSSLKKVILEIESSNLLEIESSFEAMSIDFSSPEKNPPSASLRHGNRMASVPLRQG